MGLLDQGNQDAAADTEHQQHGDDEHGHPELGKGKEIGNCFAGLTGLAHRRTLFSRDDLLDTFILSRKNGKVKQSKYLRVFSHSRRLGEI